MSEPSPDRVFWYWGKSGRDAESLKHLLVYHQLDVAAVGVVLLGRHPTLLCRLSAIMDLGEHDARQWLAWLLAHHDIGKFAAAFQKLRPDLFPEKIPDRFRYTKRHDTLGYLLWTNHLLGDVFPWLEAYSPLEDALFTLLRTSSGHHGKPPETVEWKTTWFRDADVQAARFLSMGLSGLFFGRDLPPELAPENPQAFARRIAAYSWSIAGFAVLCDWIGSNRVWFPYRDQPMDVETYWNRHAQPQAERAVTEAAVLPEPVRRKLGFAVMFPDLPDPTALQRAADTVAFAEGSQLFLIEDLTGAGKTEAALALAGRLLSAGAGEGLYVGLPTTATADAMYSRVGDVYLAMFEPGTRPSLVLAHSRRDLSLELVQSVGGDRIESEAPYDGDEEGAAATCAAWLGDSRKKALLAQVGVGTIDQALLAVLNVRHQSLRALGLIGKILIIDEVHACDAYMNRLLEHLLELHAAQGGSAVLLSATLPLETRERLVSSFAEGAGFEPPAALSKDYPQLLAVSRAGSQAIAAEPPSWSRRTLGFNLIHNTGEAIDWVAKGAETGAAVCWIRNTVGDAMEAYDRLTSRLGLGRVTLFHARFALGHRLDIEKDVLTRFGKESRAADRQGRVVVATQVIEQSLDLDFDEMLSDLAPIDRLLQRAGRLRRHRRESDGSPCSGEGCKDQRGQPVLHVLAPEPVDDPPDAWIRAFLPGTSYVYPDHAQLWRTGRLLRDLPAVNLPEDSRALIEKVFGSASSMPLPPNLERNATETEGQRRADASLGEVNAISFDAGYGGGYGSWTDLEDTRTRLGEPTVTLRLARWDGETLRPMYEGGTRPWQLSEVSIRRRRLVSVVPPQDPALRQAVKELRGDEGPKAADRLLIAMQHSPDDSSWCAQGVDSNDVQHQLRYAERNGLEVI